MGIKKIKVSNFKSFEHLEVNLDNFNIIIGANAAGKSSFVQLFEFIRNISKHGLDNAISMQGGIEYLRNINIGSKEPLSFEIVTCNSELYEEIFEYHNKEIYRETYETNYSFSLDFSKSNLEEFETVKDRLHVTFKYYEKNGNNKKDKYIGKQELVVTNDNGKLKVFVENDSNINYKDLDFEINSLPRLINGKYKDISSLRKGLIIETSFIALFESPLKRILHDIVIYNINPTLPKRATPINGKAELEEDGSNLAIVLKNIIENKEKERKFSNLVKDILPFVNKIDVEKFADKSLLFKLKETYVKDEFIPASLLSDGTINVTALIIALYFEKKQIAIIEEPERNIHPHLISKLVEMINDASKSKQIIITTHNPEIVKYIDLCKLFLVHRDSNGFSIITKPAEKEEVKVFLSNDMGIDDLYIQNLLEV